MELDYKRYAKIPGHYKCTFNYTYKGEVFANDYTVNVLDLRYPAPGILAWKEFEMDLIDKGLTTHECGCCLSDEDLVIISLDIIPLKVK